MFDRKLSPGRVAVTLIALLVLLSVSSIIAPAQEPVPRAEIFLGYSWVNIGGDAAFGPRLPGENFTSSSPSHRLNAINRGFDGSFTYNFNKWLGLTADSGAHWGSPANTHLTTVLGGPTVHFRSEHFSPFIEGLVGLARMTPPGVGANNGFGAAVGGGFDMYFSRRFAWRVAQADYLYQSHSVSSLGGSGTFNGARLQTGIVFGLGSLAPPIPPASTCTVEPSTPVLAGSPVTAHIATKNFNPKHTVTYAWKTTGGQLTSKDTSSSIDTTGLNPGSYTVTATATDAKAPKNYQTTSCTADFTIQEPPKHPPTAACSAEPTTVRSGDPSTITCQGTSPDNRPVTYSAQSTAGRLSGTGPTFTLDTAGAAAGAASINCTVTDDRGLTGTCSTQVNVTVPPPPPAASKIAEIAFPNKKKPWRVDNTAKAILDDVALRLQREPSARAVVVGYFDQGEPGGDMLAKQRAVNTKAYLTDEKGIDPGRIDVATGTAGGNRAEVYLVPAGGTFNVPGVQSFDESTVKKAPPEGRRAAPAKRAPKKAAPKQ
jgi:outer membrane protein OmpA-like peptidoglycan-associated protein